MHSEAVVLMIMNVGTGMAAALLIAMNCSTRFTDSMKNPMMKRIHTELYFVVCTSFSAKAVATHCMAMAATSMIFRKSSMTVCFL